MKTLIISSSLSESSRSFLLCKLVYDKLKAEGIDVRLIDARKYKLVPYHIGPSKDMMKISREVKWADNIIIGMGVHCYSINDSLKLILDSCFEDAKGKFFGILCSAGGNKSYLSSMHLTQICMNEWRMMQLPRIIYATNNDFSNNDISNKELLERIELFVKEFKDIGNRLIK